MDKQMQQTCEQCRWYNTAEKKCMSHNTHIKPNMEACKEIVDKVCYTSHPPR